MAFLLANSVEQTYPYYDNTDRDRFRREFDSTTREMKPARILYGSTMMTMPLRS